MDRKEQQLIHDYFHTLKERTFNEKDVHSFMSIIRPYVTDLQHISQLTELIVYRENAQGPIRDYLSACIEAIQALGKTTKKKRIPELCTFKDIRNDMHTLCQRFEVEKFTNEVLNDLTLCIISILQDICLLDPDTDRTIGHLSFGASSKYLHLMGNVYVRQHGKRIPVTFPVLSVQNRYEKIQPQDREDTPYLFDKFLMETLRKENQLVMTFPEEIHR